MYVSVLYRFVSIFDATHFFSVFVSLILGSVLIHGGGVTNHDNILCPCTVYAPVFH